MDEIIMRKENSFDKFVKEFEVIEIRKMMQIEQPNTMFGESFLWTALFKKK